MWIEVYSYLQAFFETLKLFFHFVNPFGFFIMISPFPYFAPKLFCFPCLRLLVCLARSLFIRWKNFLSLFWNALFCQYCLILCWYLFNLPPFASTLWFISSSFIVSSYCVAFRFTSQYILAFFLWCTIFTCLRFLIPVFSLISHPSFEFLLELFRETLIFLQINFAFV